MRMEIPRFERGPREHQARDIRAGNQQYQPDHRRQNHEWLTKPIAEMVHPVAAG